MAKHKEDFSNVNDLTTQGEMIVAETSDDAEFAVEWKRLTLARRVAAELIRFRSQNKLSQRALGDLLGISQPRVAKLESGEHNPEIETLVNISRVTGLEFVIDISPASRRAKFVTKSVRDQEADRVEDDVAVLSAVG